MITLGTKGNVPKYYFNCTCEQKLLFLLAQGKEEQTYNQSMYSKNSINKAILEKNKLSGCLCPSPRMVPLGLEPVCHKMIMNVVSFVQTKPGLNQLDII
jgi:hypothetical protein